MKVAILQANTTSDKITMANLAGILDQHHVYCESESICFTYFEYYNDASVAGVVKHDTLPGYFVPDWVVFTSLFYIVADDYDFVANSALDVTSISTDYMIRTLLGEVRNLAQIRSLWINTPLSNVVDTTINLTGELREVTANETSDYTTPFPVSNHHAYIYVNTATISGAGVITITGTSLSESTAIPIVGDTETIPIDNSSDQYYQTDKKWWEITSIVITSGITAIDYNVGVVGYTDSSNNDFKINGYRCDFYTQGNSSDLSLKIIKVQDDGNKKMSLHYIEDIGFDSGSSGNQIIDNCRTGDYDRSFDPTVSYIAINDSTICLKQGDFDSYYLNKEHHFLSATKNEGIIVRYEGSPDGGISQLDYANARIDFTLL